MTRRKQKDLFFFIRHPLLLNTTVVPNSFTSDIHPTKANIHILTGFNCSGKTIYTKQVREDIRKLNLFELKYFLDWFTYLYGTNR